MQSRIVKINLLNNIFSFCLTAVLVVIITITIVRQIKVVVNCVCSLHISVILIDVW